MSKFINYYEYYHCEKNYDVSLALPIKKSYLSSVSSRPKPGMNDGQLAVLVSSHSYQACRIWTNLPRQLVRKTKQAAGGFYCAETEGSDRLRSEGGSGGADYFDKEFVIPHQLIVTKY